MANDYSRQWFDVFLETVPSEWTVSEIAGVRARLPLPDFRRVLDVCCGPGRHARGLARAGYDVTGIDRDEVAIDAAAAAVPDATFLVLDQRELGSLEGPYDAALILWQSFGYFGSEDNDRILHDIASVLRPQGRLLLDVYDPRFFAERQGRTTETRDARCAAISNHLDGDRLVSTIEYRDGSQESMDWELFAPDDLAARATAAGFVEVERCCWWDQGHRPTGDEQRYQLVLERG